MHFPPHQHPPLMESPPGAECVIDGKLYLYFGGTSYLGLHGHPCVIEAACEATRRYGIHTATSRALYGNTAVTLETEQLVAEFFGLEQSYYFVSGYVSSLILLHAVRSEHELLVVDEQAHFSVREAASALGLPILVFGTRDAENLRSVLAARLKPGQRPLVLSDGVSPSLGTLSPLREYCQVLESYDGAGLLVDDAHGIGTIGSSGRGTLEHSQLWSSAVNAAHDRAAASGVKLYVCGTLSKALGGYGGIIPGSAPFVHQLRSATHYFDGASSPPVGMAAASNAALELIRAQPELRSQLQHNIRVLRSGLQQLGLSVEDSPAPIIGICLETREQMERLHQRLKGAGILVPFVQSYSGVAGNGVLRLAVFATHTAQMIGRLLDAIGRFL